MEEYQIDTKILRELFSSQIKKKSKELYLWLKDMVPIIFILFSIMMLAVCLLSIESPVGTNYIEEPSVVIDKVEEEDTLPIIEEEVYSPVGFIFDLMTIEEIKVVKLVNRDSVSIEVELLDTNFDLQVIADEAFELYGKRCYVLQLDPSNYDRVEKVYESR